MKKILFITIFLFGIFSTTVSAESPVEERCDIVDQSNYGECCIDLTKEYTVACKNYRDGTAQKTDAEWKQYCSAIGKVSNQSDYENCCNYEHDVAYNQTRCYDWYRDHELDQGTPDIKGGSQDTNSNFYSPFTGAQDNNNVSFVGPSSSPALKECSAIKFKSLLDILIWVKCVITSVLIPLIFALAFVFFLWNVFVFMRSDDKTNKEEAKQRMGWGIIALFVMVGVWGIIAILSKTLGVTPSVPLLQTEYLDPANASK